MRPAATGRRLSTTVALAVLIACTLAGSSIALWRETRTARPAAQRIPHSGPPRTPAAPASPTPMRTPEPPATLPNRDLAAGMKGPAVRLLQTMLEDLGYDVPVVDGKFGEDTHHAVVAFQKVHDLERDGVVGAATRAALRLPLTPELRHPDWRGTFVEVNLTKQVLYLVEEGGITAIHDVSTGGGYSFVSRGVRKVAVTATGDYEVYLQYDGWYESSVGPMYKSSFWLRGFAIHGSFSVPPYPASHGCVRMTLSAIERLWPKLRLGTKVSVYRT